MTLIPARPSSDEVPSLGRRQFMNLLTFGAVTGVALGALYPVVRYFIPPREAGLSGGALALDELRQSDRSQRLAVPATRKATAAWCRVSRAIPPI